MFNGTNAQLSEFGTFTHATYPLCLNASFGNGNEDWYIPYVDRDNWVVINKQGIIRYHAADRWPYGSRYHLNEIRGAIDSLVTNPLVNVNDDLTRLGYALKAGPSPFRSSLAIEFTNPASTELDAHVTVHDVAGRRVATLWGGPSPRGRTRVSWDGRTANGSPSGPGLYFIRSEVGGVRLSRRVVALQ